MYSVKIYLYLCKKDTVGSPLFTEMSTVPYRTLAYRTVPYRNIAQQTIYRTV